MSVHVNVHTYKIMRMPIKVGVRGMPHIPIVQPYSSPVPFTSK